MASDQQICLVWNNHQKALVKIFDKFLSNERLVDCTLAAEGKYMKVHKVLLSACSPYFEMLLCQHYDKHPIIILKDVTFRELKALVDYMYRGELSYSRDQLAALVKVAENLQIKGLSDSERNRTGPKEKPPEKRVSPLPPQHPAQQPSPCPVLTFEQDRTNQDDHSQDSPSIESSLDHTLIESHHDSFSRDSSSLNIAANFTSTPVALIPDQAPVLDCMHYHILSEPPQPTQQDILHKTGSSTGMLLEQHHENFTVNMNEDIIEDWSLYEVMNNLDHSQARPSGKGSIQDKGFNPRRMESDGSTDEVLLQDPEAVCDQRDSQEILRPKEKMTTKQNLTVIMNEDIIEDLSLYEVMNNVNHSQAGFSGEGSIQDKGFNPRRMESDGSTDEVLLQDPEAVCDQRDSQEILRPKEKMTTKQNLTVIMNEDIIEDLSLYEVMNNVDHSQAGPSGEGSIQDKGFDPRRMESDGSTDEVLMQDQEAVGAQQDSQKILRQEEKIISDGEDVVNFSSKETEILINIANDSNRTSILIPNLEEPNSDSKEVIGISSQPRNLAQESKARHIKESRNISMHLQSYAIIVAGSTSDNEQIMLGEPSSHLSTSHGDEQTETIVQCAHCPKSFIRKKQLRRHLKYSNCKTELVECGQCSQLFNTKSSLIHHLRNVCGKRKQHICDYCKKQFKFEKNLRYHMKRKCGKINVYKCPKCQKQFRLRQNLKSHLKNECARKKEFRCPKCKQQFISRVSLDHHVRNDCGKVKKFSCLCCFKTYETKSTLNAHLKHDCGRTEPHKCPQCQRLFARKQSLDDHLRNSCCKKDTFSCPSCSKQFKWKSTLNAHMKHDCGRTEPHKCPQCQKSFVTKVTLDRHMKHDCGITEPHKCPKCQELFFKKNTLAEHLRYRCGKNETFSCPSCFKKYKNKSCLNAHIKYDCGRTNPHKCPQCQSVFVTKDSLNQHMKQDCGKTKPHKCPQCQRLFGSKSTLDMHMKHDCGRTEPHKCPRCQRSFLKNKTLDVHLRYNCGKNETFVCPSCSKQFPNKGHLKAHVKHDCGRTEPHKCPQCQKLFSIKRCLDVHLKNRCGKK